MRRAGFIIFISLFFISISHADDQSDIFDDMLKNARNGDVEAMCDLGVAYFNGDKTLKDPFKAKCWIKKAYNKESTRAKTLWDDMQLWRYSGKCDLSFDDELLPKHGRGDVFNDPVTETQFVFVPKGCFLMGCHEAAEKCDKDEKPLHKVCIDGFWMGKYEVTQKLWENIMGSGKNPARFHGNLDRPVENISFHEAQKFIQILNSKGREKYSLPTEAQWEYACRNGGKKVSFPWGNQSYRPNANCGTCDSGSFYGETAPVGSFPPNELGLFDMAGNVKEWCQDVYHKKSYDRHSKNNPVFDSKGSSRVVRGGGFTDNTSNLRCTSRYKFIPGMKSDYIGFRLVMTYSK